MDIKQKLKMLPQSPGVYLMSDALGNTIYVGKAKNLKQRVSHYFTLQKHRMPKVEEMIKHIHSFDYCVYDTEFEALIEECRLIKEIKPRFNRLMKNEKRYCYLMFPAEPYPKVTKVNQRPEDGALYFGPFTSPGRIDTLIDYLNEFYPLRKCPSPHLVPRVNGCLYKQLGSCLGVCSGQVSPEEYQGYVTDIEQLIGGKRPEAFKELQRATAQAVEALNFERAARLKEYERGLKYVIRWQQFAQSPQRNRNFVAIDLLNSNEAKVFFIKGQLLDRARINIVDTADARLHADLKQRILDIFSPQKRNKSDLTPDTLDEAQIIHSYLKNHRHLLCFWIPASRLNPQDQRLDEIVTKIVDRIRERMGLRQ